MKIKTLHIKNFKSLVDLKIDEPNPFTVFVGGNGVGKSNIFEALEFVTYSSTTFFDSAIRAFGGESDIANNLKEVFKFDGEFEDFSTHFISDFNNGDALLQYLKIGHNSAEPLQKNHSNFYPGELPHRIPLDSVTGKRKWESQSRQQFFGTFFHIFINAVNKEITKYNDDKSLSLSASNMEKVLKRILLDENKKNGIIEYLQLFVPGFKDVEIHSDNLSGTDTLLIYEQGSKRPFNKNLISDGTYNILCLLTAIFQSDEPQFLCIEEPENGLSPYAIEVLVELIRNKCQDEGHYIWLNTHSQTLVRHLKEEELILVNKVNGATEIKQLKQGDFFGLNADDAWLTNALGAGLPW